MVHNQDQEHITLIAVWFTYRTLLHEELPQMWENNRAWPKTKKNAYYSIALLHCWCWENNLQLDASNMTGSKER
jgi:hypothetical protein